MNAYARLMLPLARKFVYDIAPKTSIFSHDIEVNVEFQNRFSRCEFMLDVNSPFSVRNPIPDSSTRI